MAEDNIGVDRVEVELNEGSFLVASGTNSWQARVTLVPGPNRVQVRSVDLAGNVSFPATRFITYVVKLPLTVHTVGQGTVRPNRNGRLLEIGKAYVLRARPRSGSIFARWSGAPAQGPSLRFVMQSNLVLTAEFVPNPFLPLRGRYTGRIVNTNAAAPGGSGSFALQLGGFGSFVGRAKLDSRSIFFQGRFDAAGRARVSVLRRSNPPIVFQLNLDGSGATNAVRGVVTDGTWVSILEGYRDEVRRSPNPTPPPGGYAVYPQQTDPAEWEVVGEGNWAWQQAARRAIE
jgi:hypothetical protein